ncbi:MAG: PadR family transcriptional regulator [Alphaproteobacteria bacterium]|nr:PadR family transcriptional regulator [Alphaproteobacteria bacterium]
MDVKTLCLGVLSLGPASGYEIKKVLEGPLGSFFDASYGSIYPALARLAEGGLVSVEEKPQERRPDKKIYTITSRGRITLASALEKRPGRDRVRSDFAATMLFADLLSPRELATCLDDRIAHHRAALQRLEAGRADPAVWGGGEITAGMRFVADLGMAQHRAALDFLESQRHVVEAAALRKTGQAAD